jgi:hypothetical protein
MPILSVVGCDRSGTPGASCRARSAERAHLVGWLVPMTTAVMAAAIASSECVAPVVSAFMVNDANRHTYRRHAVGEFLDFDTTIGANLCSAASSTFPAAPTLQSDDPVGRRHIRPGARRRPGLER